MEEMCTYVHFLVLIEQSSFFKLKTGKKINFDKKVDITYLHSSINMLYLRSIPR